MYFVYYSFDAYYIKLNTTLENEGYIQWQSQHPLDKMSPSQIKNTITPDVLNKLPEGYVFLDYIYYIKGCSLSTFHRDVTSGQKYYNTIHPTYTAIVYLYDGDFLSICPESHKQYPFTWSRPVNINGEKNKIILFNADALHSGIINKIGYNRRVAQYKVVHQDDIPKVEHLNKINVIKEGECNINYWLETILRFLSYHFSFILHTFLYPFMQKKHDNQIIAFIQDWFPLKFYNNG